MSVFGSPNETEQSTYIYVHSVAKGSLTIDTQLSVAGHVAHRDGKIVSLAGLALTITGETPLILYEAPITIKLLVNNYEEHTLVLQDGKGITNCNVAVSTGDIINFKNAFSTSHTLGETRVSALIKLKG